ncbi:hypothetical protein [Rhizobium laguerreae]|uniref:Uncharacterized protein n=1 Tax=Rhizobium laguerreae TaxID=1076926 RepID=A0ABR6GB22_9HYPH|nr:hypothetical protein [Rhizobium laguerreae]MBB3162798.1 hypothetical protein [Rhizobium laguerreae]MBY3105683.1 hypothetical protein [Rhizobium laguerreae]MBY3345123.1 hypothetical protein [Rhizobium laguerreae]MBY3353043.1 hypothetical protein [Rhizobium laguerreae]MBY3373106.1 hypothetical protein [Rhizobium laguerreae]
MAWPATKALQARPHGRNGAVIASVSFFARHGREPGSELAAGLAAASILREHGDDSTTISRGEYHPVIYG